jgi:hypothetical protein
VLTLKKVAWEYWWWGLQIGLNLEETVMFYDHNDPLLYLRIALGLIRLYWQLKSARTSGRPIKTKDLDFRLLLDLLNLLT